MLAKGFTNNSIQHGADIKPIDTLKTSKERGTKTYSCLQKGINKAKQKTKKVVQTKMAAQNTIQLYIKTDRYTDTTKYQTKTLGPWQQQKQQLQQ